MFHCGWCEADPVPCLIGCGALTLIGSDWRCPVGAVALAAYFDETYLRRCAEYLPKGVLSSGQPGIVGAPYFVDDKGEMDSNDTPSFVGLPDFHTAAQTKQAYKLLEVANMAPLILDFYVARADTKSAVFTSLSVPTAHKKLDSGHT